MEGGAIASVDYVRAPVRLVARIAVLCVAALSLSACLGERPSHVADHSGSCLHFTCANISDGRYRIGAGTSDVELQVEPNDGVDKIVKAVDNAQRTIFVQAYILSNKRIVRTLDRASAEGVRVYVLLDHYPYGIVQQPETMLAELQAAGIHVRWAPSYFEFSHAKFMVLDDDVAIISSANFSKSGFASDRDFVVVDHNPLDVRETDNIFRSDWDRINPRLNDPNLIVSPVTAASGFSDLVGEARKSIDLYSEEVLEPEIVRELIAAVHRGVRVRVMAATISSVLRKRLIEADVAVGDSSSAGNLYLHAKALIVDGKLAFVGSENFSATSLQNNRELGVLVSKRSAVSSLEATFDRDWATMAHA